ncbi:hypothetical protein CspeluHIS016_0102380 [Cutaneotrichosporon spelunceum]|uniref:Bms1-type G domain-containing protein n=1 Tax=Cutaneotrichosporon spelunceum TaxID=1672016 RepID=A0AAD3TNI1_9TREE|nr:hypothetical protein CspeluHIS016_0102380 [Cutaneotrichosporon spelunceum]
MAPQAHHHRPTLKQSNKSFKSKHASKGARKAAAKGKPAAIAAPSVSSHKAVDAGAKRMRLNQQSQKRDAKQRAGREDAKFFSMSSNGGPSHCLNSLGLSDGDIAGLNWDGHSSFVTMAPRFKSSIHFNLLPPLQVFSALDAALASDIVILLLSSVDEVQLEGEAVLRCLQGQAGGVTALACVQAPESNPLTGAAKSLVNKSLLSFSRYFFPSVNKVFSADTANEAILLARALCETSPASIQHPDGRAWLVAEEEPVWTAAAGTANDIEQQVAEPGSLRVTGTVRGGRLSANRLVHLPGFGDFQISEISAARSLSTRDSDGCASAVCLSSPGDEADDLTANNVPDLLANEQTWPTEEEMMGAQGAETDDLPKRVKRVPKGTSAYQAAWIFDDDDEDDCSGVDSEAESASDMMDTEAMESDLDAQIHNETEELEEVELDARSEDHQEMTAEEEEAQYEAYLRERERAQRDDINFPDEIDTPRHIAASVRFQRYRGLRSFRTSPWDPYENLPLDYGEIFQFENFSATQKRVEREAREEGVQLGTRVTLVINNVPRETVAARGRGTPFVVHGLLRHEHKQTVLHFAVQRNTEYTQPDPLVLCAGPRRYNINPLFSQHVRGGGKGVNNVHKSERYLKPGSTTVVTTYGPACFGKLPCLLLKQGSQGLPDLVAMGSFLSSDPTRIIAKRIVLTGHPFKVHKKTATIRYMFFNREDVHYFQSVELHTKYGRTGHITEALGTHGYFKAHFDGPIQQMDAVCMSLYKRQFPKWSTTFQSQTVTEIKQDDSTSMEFE